MIFAATLSLPWVARDVASFPRFNLVDYVVNPDVVYHDRTTFVVVRVHGL